MRWLICLGVILAGCGTVKASSRTGALKAITTVRASQVHYAQSMKDLGPAGADLIGRDLASGEKDGYRFLLTLTTKGYLITVAGRGGARWYSADREVNLELGG